MAKTSRYHRHYLCQVDGGAHHQIALFLTIPEPLTTVDFTKHRLHSNFITLVHHERRVWWYIVVDQWDVLGRHGVGYTLIIRQPLLYEEAVLPSWPI